MPQIVLARIDNRLIHGQVLESWVPFTQAEVLVVANDRMAASPLQQKMLAAAVPSHLRVVVTGLEAAAAFLSGPEPGRVLLLFANAEDAWRAHRLGISLSELNLGNMHGGEGKQRLSCTLAVTPQDLIWLQQLAAAGVRIVARCIPTDPPCDWSTLCKEVGE